MTAEGVERNSRDLGEQHRVHPHRRFHPEYVGLSEPMGSLVPGGFEFPTLLLSLFTARNAVWARKVGGEQVKEETVQWAVVSRGPSSRSALLNL